MHEKGREMAIALEPILETCSNTKYLVLTYENKNTQKDKKNCFLDSDIPEVAQENKNMQACSQSQELEHPAKP